MQYIVGIDPGVTTGFAVAEVGKGLTRVEGMKIHRAIDEVKALHAAWLLRLVVFEDARLRKWLGTKGREAAQGAGSIKRDCKIWEDFLQELGCPYQQIAPQKGATKWSAEYFAKVTGWEARTNNHGRDAACLIIGKW
jgi:hypothetical protein